MGSRRGNSCKRPRARSPSDNPRLEDSPHVCVIRPPVTCTVRVTERALRLIEAPGAWLTGFIDSAEEIWSTDPLLSEDEDLYLTAGQF